MAPMKRTLDAYLFADESLGGLDSTVEILTIEPGAVDQHLFSFPTKKLKTTLSTLDEAEASKNDLAGYLDFGEPGSPDAVVPSAKELVSGTDDWLGSQPSSPSHVFHELPGDDDWLSSGPSSPSSDLDFGEQSPPSNELFSDVFNPVFGAGDVMDRTAVGMLQTTPESETIQQSPTASPTTTLAATIQASIAPAAKVTTKAKVSKAATVARPMVPATARTANPLAKAIAKAPKAAKVKAPKATTSKKSKAAAEAAAAAAAAALAAAAAAQPDPPEHKADANRWAHNSTERKRRCEIRRLFSDLRDLFSDLHGDDRVSNITTLSRAIQCVTELDREAMEQAMALHTLRERNASLKAAAAARNGGVLPAKFSQPQPSKPRQYRAPETATKTIISDTYPQQIQIAPGNPTSVTSVPTSMTGAAPTPTNTTVVSKEASDLLAQASVSKEASDLIARASENPSLRRALPHALRELMDHNGRGACEAGPLPPRRPKTVVA